MIVLDCLERLYCLDCSSSRGVSCLITKNRLIEFQKNFDSSFISNLRKSIYEVQSTYFL